MAARSRSYKGASTEDRVNARRRRLLNAAFACLAAGQWRHVSIDSLCRTANLNKRYFYESFANLDALAASVVDGLAAELLAIGLAAAKYEQEAGRSTDALAREVMRVVIGWLVAEPGRARVLFAEAGDGAHAQAHRKAVIRRLAHELSNFGHVYHGSAEPQPIARAAAALLIGGTIEALLGWLDNDIDLPLDAFVDDIATFWVTVGTAAVTTATRRHKAPRAKPPKKSRPRRPA
jgi:AcrR family transcriptional regulator